MSSIPARIDVARYMQMRSAYAPTFGHDDGAVYFLMTMTGEPQVWKLDGAAPWPKQISYFAQRVQGVSASPADDILCVTLDNAGSERTQLGLLDAEGLHYQAITNDPEHIYHFGGWSHDGRTLSYSSNRRNGVHFDVYLYELSTDTHTILLEHDSTNYARGFSPDDRFLLIDRHHASLSNDLYLIEIATGEVTWLTPHEGRARYGGLRFGVDDNTLYVLTDQGHECMRLLRIDRTTGVRTWMTDDTWDVTSLSLSFDGRYLAYVRNEDGTSRLYVVDKMDEIAIGQESAQNQSMLEHMLALPELPAGVFAAHFNRAGYTLALTVSSPLYANDIWLLYCKETTLKRVTYASLSAVPQQTFVEPELIHYQSFDGLRIPAYYYKPRSRVGPYPVIIDVHGGPEGQSANAFSGLTQYFVQRGFAVLRPNVRGSSGYGRTYLHLDDVRKRMDSVADLASCVPWLLEHGAAKQGAIAVMGGSYGGFMVLAALTHYPALFAAGVDIVGIANLRTFMENTSAYRRHLRESEYGTIAEDGDFFDQISPIHHVDKIVAPLFVVHGANDPRVPVGEAEQMVAALRARNHPVTYLRFEDEGHGIAKLDNRIQTYTQIAAFLEQVLS